MDPNPQRPSSGKGGFILLAVLGVAGLVVGFLALNYALRGSRTDEEALLHGSLIGGAGLLLLAFAAGKLINNVVAVLLVLIAGAAGYLWVQQGLSTQGDAQADAAQVTAMYDAVLPVCSEGATLPQATVYDGEPGLHPTAIFIQTSDGSWYAWRNSTPEAWVPGAVEQTQLVVCVVTSSQNHQSCSYSVAGGTRMLNRVQYHRDVTVKDAQTGQVRHTARVSGSVPPECPTAASFGEHEYSRELSGSLPSDEAVLEVIREWVDVPL